jgi:hypothetical protein
MNSITLIFILFIVGQNFLPRELIFGLAFLLLFSNSFKGVRIQSLISGFQVISPILLLLFLGVFTIDFAYTGRDIARDIYLVGKIVILFFVGISVAKYVINYSHFYHILAICAGISAIKHIIMFIVNFSSDISFGDLRWASGTESLIEAIFAAMYINNLVFTKEHQKVKKLPFNRIFTLLLFSSFVMYLSRTMIVNFVIVLFSISTILSYREIFTRKNLNIAYILIFFSALFLFVQYLISINIVTNNLLIVLFNKIQNIPEEILWSTKRDNEATINDINLFWRGYESYRGIVKFLDGTIIQKFCGHGWGTLVDLGLSIKLGDQFFEEIPIFHNAYVYLLVKVGILGILLFLIFLYNLGFKKSLKLEGDCIMYSNLTSGLTMVVALNTFIISGLFGTDVMLPFLLGLTWKLSN